MIAEHWKVVARFRILKNETPGTAGPYRCRASTIAADDHHFTTKTANCDGNKMEALLGYTGLKASTSLPTVYHGCEYQNAFPDAVRVAQFDAGACKVYPTFTVVDTGSLGFLKVLTTPAP